MATYVLVHGAWHGAWCSQDVADPLRKSGHDVLTPTLTGLGEKAHLFTPEIGLRTHVDDVVGLLRQEQLHDVVLVGHSYAGLVVREAADREAGRVARIILVDGWAGDDGESMDSLAPERFRRWIDSVTTDGAIAAPPAGAVGVTDPELAARVEPRLTRQPRRTFAEPTVLTGAVDAIPCRALICTPPGSIPFGRWANDLGVATAEIESGHDAMITVPEALSDLLLEDT